MCAKKARGRYIQLGGRKKIYRQNIPDLHLLTIGSYIRKKQENFARDVLKTFDKDSEGQ